MQNKRNIIIIKKVNTKSWYIYVLYIEILKKDKEISVVSYASILTVLVNETDGLI